MYLLLGISIFLGLILAGVLIDLMAVKRELRRTAQELALTRNQSYNRQLTISLVDRDLSAAVTEINRNLDYQKKLKLEHEQAEIQMKQSISDIAHDLRTPLTVIKGNLQILENEGGLTGRSGECLRICQEKSDTLKEMVDDFFELSVLESDHTPAKLQEVDLTNALMQFILDHEAVIRAHALEPEFHFPEKSILIQADEQMLGRMFGNLLNNIVKYANNRFQIELETVEEGRRCRVRFSNEVERDRQFDAAHLFDRSYRGDRSRSGNGAGLGLYIVKLLAQKQGAVVSAERSENLLMIDLYFSCRVR